MGLQYSSIVAITYFSTNVVFLHVLAIYVYKAGSHNKVKSKSFLKDLWNQRKILLPLLIHFYDTATDIGVLYNWAELMKQENSMNFESIDMATFFWCGIAFLLLYRVLLLGFALFDWLVGDDGEWYHFVLVLLDLYIFVVVYESFNEAQGIITKNAAKRAANIKKKEQKAVQQQLSKSIEAGKISDKQAQIIQDGLQEIQEIEPADKQMMIQLMEAMTESMPQIILQSVFVLRSQNDPLLRESAANFSLIILSVLASLFSIASKYGWYDKDGVAERAKSLKPKQRFPDCINYWYLVRIAWRVCHILAKFAVFTLIWSVLGGAWLPIWAGLVLVVWCVVFYFNDDVDSVIGGALYAIVYLVASIDTKKEYRMRFALKWVETTIGLILITIFGTIKFECGICHDSGNRMIFKNESNNDMILIYWIMGVLAHIIDAMLYLVLYFANILLDGKEESIYHNRWGYEFGYDDGEPFKHLIEDHKTQKITGIRLWGDNEYVSGIEFEVNGVWMGKHGKKSDSEPDAQLILNTDEYINCIIIYTNILILLFSFTSYYVEFRTSEERSISAGKKPETEKDIVTLNGDFKLVDCKGKSNDKGVRKLQFLWHKID